MLFAPPSNSVKVIAKDPSAGMTSLTTSASSTFTIVSAAAAFAGTVLAPVVAITSAPLRASTFTSIGFAESTAVDFFTVRV